MDKKCVIAIIPARGGSVAIPKKNLAPLCGEPLLGWTIDQALSTAEIDRVYVSTDSDEIATFAISKGADVIERPADIAGGEATSESAIKHALETIKSTSKFYPDIVVFLQATSPLRKPSDISSAIKLFEGEGADSLFSSSIAADLTLWNKGAGGWESVNFDFQNRQTRQAAPIQYIENGSIYIFHPELIIENNNRLGKKIESYIMEPWQAHEIDVEEDIELVAYYMEKLLIGSK